MSLNERPKDTLFSLIAKKVRVYISNLLQLSFDEQAVDRTLDREKNRTFITIETQGSLGAGDIISDILDHRQI